MINLLHTADIHIGMENYGRIDSATGFHTRLLDFLNSLDQMVDYAIENCDVVLISGDIYKVREPNNTHQREFARRIKRLIDNNIPVVLNCGNHDQPNTEGRARAIEIYKALDLPGVYIATKPEIFLIDTKNGPLQIACIPYLSKSFILKKDEDLTSEQLRDRMRTIIEDIVRSMAQRIDKNLPSVLSAHLSVDNAEVGSEQSIMMGSEIVVPTGVIAREEFDYIALGHIHKYQVVHDNPLTVYSGSLDRIDFSEEKEEKGFCHVFIERGSVTHKFIPVNTRPFKTIVVEVEEDNPTENILKEAAKFQLNSSIVRLILKLSQEANLKIRYKEIAKFFNENSFYFSGISREWKKRNTLVRDAEITEKLDPLSALEKYFLSRGDIKCDKNELLKRAESLYREILEGTL